MKKIFAVLILSLVVAYPNFCIDPPPVDSLDDEYILIGSFIIHMSQINEDNFKAASLSITDTQKIYYKSKFADGTWFRVDEAVEIKDVILKGNSGTMKSAYMDSYFKFTLMIEPGGNTIKFGDEATALSTNPQIVTLENLIKEKEDQITAMMAQVKGDIKDPSNEAIVTEVAQLNYDKSLLENFDDDTTIEKQKIKEKLAEIEKAIEDNNLKLEYELYNELEELDPSSFNTSTKLELLLNSLEDIESLNDLKSKFLANGFEKMVEELELEIASKNEVVEKLSSKLLNENLKKVLVANLSDEEKEKILAMNELIDNRMNEAALSASEVVLDESIESLLENIENDLVDSLINFEAAMNIKTGQSLIDDLLNNITRTASKLKNILIEAGGSIESVVQKDSLTIDLIKNKSETLLAELNKSLGNLELFYEEILSSDFDSKSNMFLTLESDNKLLISKLEELGELERLQKLEANIEKDIVLLSKEIASLNSGDTPNDSSLESDDKVDTNKDVTDAEGNIENEDNIDLDNNNESNPLNDDSNNKLTLSAADRKLKEEKEKLLLTTKAELVIVKEKIAIIIGSLNVEELMDKLLLDKEKLMIYKTKLDINSGEVDAIKNLANEVDGASKSISKKEILEDPRLIDPITGLNLKSDVEALSKYSDEIIGLLNKSYEADMLKLFKERYYLIKDYNSDKKKTYTKNLELYTSRIKEIDSEIYTYKNHSFVDKEFVDIRYEYWLAVISKDFENQSKYLEIINEYESLSQKLEVEKNINDMSLKTLNEKLFELGFESNAEFVENNLLK